MGYDFEDDLGFVAEDRRSAKTNAQKLASLSTASWPGGNYKFVNGKTGPVLKKIEVQAKEFFFDPPKTGIKLSKRAGLNIEGYGSRPWVLPSGLYNIGGGAQGGAATRWTNISAIGAAFFDQQGCSNHFTGIMFSGRDYYHDPTGEGPDGLENPQPRSSVCFRVAGDEAPPTGMHTWTRCGFSDFDVALHAACTPVETHADNCLVDACLFNACGTAFKSENMQAIPWYFRNPIVSYFGGKGLRPFVFVDLIRGGNIFIDGCSLNHPLATIYRVDSFAPSNTRKLTFTNFKWDLGEEFPANGANVPQKYLNLMQYVGWYTDPGMLSSLRWDADFSGQIGSGTQRGTYFELPNGFPVPEPRLTTL
jgi:hypothetical protein